MDKKRVYTFGNGQAEGKADMRNLLGGKGASQSRQKFAQNIMKWGRIKSLLC